MLSQDLCDTTTYLLVNLEGDLKLQVVPGGQDVAKSGLVRPETTLASLQHIIRLFRTNVPAIVQLVSI